MMTGIVIVLLGIVVGLLMAALVDVDPREYLQQQCLSALLVQDHDALYCVRENGHSGPHESDGGRVKWAQAPTWFQPKDTQTKEGEA